MSDLNGEQFGGLHLFEPKPYFPHRGSPEKRHQGTQGKLFRDPKPADDVRYPRGYTPERMDAVRSQPIHVHVGEDRRGQKGASFTGPAGAERVWQTLARSTLPADHIQRQFNGDVLKVKTSSPAVSSSAYAHYAYSRMGGHGEIHLGRDAGEQRMGQSLLHEIGHAHSTQEVLPHAMPDTRAKLGQEEAYADDTMVRHWRPDPRDVRRGKASTPEPGYEMKTAFHGLRLPGNPSQTGGATAAKAYRAARQTPIQSDIRQARRQDRGYQVGMFHEALGGGYRINPDAAPAHPEDLGSKDHHAFRNQDTSWQPFRGGDGRRPQPAPTLEFHPRPPRPSIDELFRR